VKSGLQYAVSANGRKEEEEVEGHKKERRLRRPGAKKDTI
jgi:hypothetical protein